MIAHLRESIRGGNIPSRKQDQLGDGLHCSVSLRLCAADSRRNTSESLGYTCKHGELECIGNSHQLCLHKHLSLSDFYTNLACQNNFYDDIGKISLTKQCAELSKTKWLESGVGECVEGKESERLFKRNVEKTIADEVGTSCTINIDSTIVYGGARRCVVDGGVWRGCNVSQDMTKLTTGWPYSL